MTLALFITGCSMVPSTGRRAATVALGAAGGGAAGYVLGDKSPGWAVAGAGLGALATAAALGRDREVEQAGFDDGYVQGQADAIKRQYFLRQALERQPLVDETVQGNAVHYVVPGPSITTDGRKLEPHTVTLTVTE